MGYIFESQKAKLDEKLDDMSLADSEKQNDDTENDIQESLISSSQVPSENYSENVSGKQTDETENLETLTQTSTEHHSLPSWHFLHSANISFLSVVEYFFNKSDYFW